MRTSPPSAWIGDVRSGGSAPTRAGSPPSVAERLGPRHRGRPRVATPGGARSGTGSRAGDAVPGAGTSLGSASASPGCRHRGIRPPRPGHEEPHRRRAEQHDAQHPAERGRPDADVLEAGREDDERDRPAGCSDRERSRRAASQRARPGTLPRMSDAVTPNSTWPKASAPERRGGGERDGLREIGADELVGAERRVQEQEQHDHQRARADRGHPDDDAADHADGDRGQRPRDGPRARRRPRTCRAAPVDARSATPSRRRRRAARCRARSRPCAAPRSSGRAGAAGRRRTRPPAPSRSPSSARAAG